MRTFASIILLAFATTSFAAPIHLRTNSLVEPIGIDSPKPLFSWQSSASTPNWKQTGYEVLVATSDRLLVPGRADIWDSGHIDSSESVNIPFTGQPLEAQRRYACQHDRTPAMVRFHNISRTRKRGRSASKTVNGLTEFARGNSGEM